MGLQAVPREPLLSPYPSDWLGVCFGGCLSSAPVVTLICTKQLKWIHSDCCFLAGQWYPWSWTDFVLYFNDQAFFIYFCTICIHNCALITCWCCVCANCLLDYGPEALRLEEAIVRHLQRRGGSGLRWPGPVIKTLKYNFNFKEFQRIFVYKE